MAPCRAHARRFLRNVRILPRWVGGRYHHCLPHSTYHDGRFRHTHPTTLPSVGVNAHQTFCALTALPTCTHPRRAGDAHGGTPLVVEEGHRLPLPGDHPKRLDVAGVTVSLFSGVPYALSRAQQRRASHHTTHTDPVVWRDRRETRKDNMATERSCACAYLFSPLQKKTCRNNTAFAFRARDTRARAPVLSTSPRFYYIR